MTLGWSSVDVASLKSVASHALDLLWPALLLLAGLEIGIRKGGHLAPDGRSPLQRFVAFWLAGSDGRVNYTRATAFFGCCGFLVITLVVLHKYEASGQPEITALIVCLTASLAMLGINLANFGVSNITQVKLAAIANPPPAAPPAPPPPATVPATQVNVNAAPAEPARRDSGMGATQLLPATPPPDNPPPG